MVIESVAIGKLAADPAVNHVQVLRLVGICLELEDRDTPDGKKKHHHRQRNINRSLAQRTVHSGATQCGTRKADRLANRFFLVSHGLKCFPNQRDPIASPIAEKTSTVGTEIPPTCKVCPTSAKKNPALWEKGRDFAACRQAATTLQPTEIFRGLTASALGRWTVNRP